MHLRPTILRQMGNQKDPISGSNNGYDHGPILLKPIGASTYLLWNLLTIRGTTKL
jgi:hypothetical protein